MTTPRIDRAPPGPRIGRFARALAASVATGCIFITADDIDRRNPPALALPSDVAVFVTGIAPDPLAEPRGPVADCVGDPATPLRAVPVGGAAVTVTGASGSPQTDLSGRVWFDAVPAGRLVVAVEREGYAPGRAVLDLEDGATTSVSVPIAPTNRTALLRPDKGSAVVRDCVFSLVFPAGALGDETADAFADWAWIEPGEGAGPDKVADDGRPLDAVAVVWFGGVTRGGASVDLTAPALLRVDLPEGDPRRTLDLGVWAWDETAGAWVRSAGITDEPGYVVGQVTAPGWWAIGAPQGGLSCASGTVGSAEGPVAAAEVRSVAADSPGLWRSRAGIDGGFCVPVASGSLGNIDWTGIALDRTAVYTARQPFPAGIASGTCDGTCITLGTVTTAAHADADGDTFWAGDEPADAPGSWDCDDGSAQASPIVSDALGDGEDTNCDGVDGVDADRDGTPAADDCDDADPMRHPGRVELCNGVDDDCNERADGVDGDLVGAALTAEGTCHPCTSAAVMALQPKLYWRLADQDVNRAHDSSGFGNDGEIVGLEERYFGVTDQSETAPRFPGVLSQYVRLGKFDQIGVDALSISFWMRPQSARRTLLSYAVPSDGTSGEVSDAANELALTGPNADSLQFRLKDQSTSFVKTETYLPQLAWSHVVVTWERDGTPDDPNIQVFVDGLRRSTAYLTRDEDELDTGYIQPYPVEIVPGGVLFLGQNQDAWGTTAADASLDSYQSFEGMLDEVAMFDRVLRPSEVEALYLSATCGETCVDSSDDVSEDGDEFVNEPFLGSAQCPAEDCAEIFDNQSSIGDGYYHLDSGAFAYCEMDPAGPLTHFCGDGELFNDADHPLETCDGEPRCTECAFEVPAAHNCQELAENGYAKNGPYWVTDPSNPPALMKVVCLLEGNDPGWTLVFSHDSAQGVIFAHPPTLPGQLEILPSPAPYDDPTDPVYGVAYSILDRLADMVGPNGYEFRMDWPLDSNAVYTWTQVSNPAFDADTSDTGAEPVTGFANLEVSTSAAGDGAFKGLQRRGDDWSLISGKGTGAYQVGVFISGVQGPLGGANQLLAAPAISPDATARKVELWARPW